MRTSEQKRKANNKAAKKYYDANAEQKKAARRSYYEKYRDKCIAASKAHYQENKSAYKLPWKRGYFKRKYGLSLDQIQEMISQQNKRCLICDNQFDLENIVHKGPRKMRPCVDHNHETGKIRGIICNNCNLVIGYANDNPAVLTNAIRYLQERV